MLSCRAWSLVLAINVWTKYCRYTIKTIAREKRSIRVETAFIWEVGCVEKLFISTCIGKATRCSWLGVFFDFYVLWMGLRVGSVKELRKISGRVGSGYAFSGSDRVGSQNLDPRSTLSPGTPACWYWISYSSSQGINPIEDLKWDWGG